MITIHKYPVTHQPSWELELPVGAVFLAVQTQGNMPVMWMMVDDQAPKKLVKFSIRETGADCTDLNNESWKYLGTFQINGGQLMFHLFTHAPVTMTIEPNAIEEAELG